MDYIAIVVKIMLILKEAEIVKKRMTITEVAQMVGISPKTLARWEKVGKIRKPKRDWRGWRVYDDDDLTSIRKFHETLFEVQ